MMPNTPCIVREGASVFCTTPATSDKEATDVQSLFRSVGECHEVPEGIIDAVTAVSASGPAYMYMIIGNEYTLENDKVLYPLF